MVKLSECGTNWYRERDIYNLLASHHRNQPQQQDDIIIKAGVVRPFYTTCVDKRDGTPWYDPQDPTNQQPNWTKLFIAVLEYVPEEALKINKSTLGNRIDVTKWMDPHPPEMGPHLES